jgi:hypothetical protein
LGERASLLAGRPSHRALHKGHASEGERGRRGGGKEEEWVYLSFGEGARRGGAATPCGAAQRREGEPRRKGLGAGRLTGEKKVGRA